MLKNVPDKEELSYVRIYLFSVFSIIYYRDPKDLVIKFKMPGF